MPLPTVTVIPTVAPTATDLPRATASPTVVTPTRVSSPTPTAAPTQVLSAACTNSTSRITGFYSGGRRIDDLRPIPTLYGYITIYMIANAPNFQYYKLDYSGDNRNSWVTAINSRSPLVDIMGLGWATTSVPNGNYWMRVVVVDKTGNFATEPCEIKVVINNFATVTPAPSAIGCQDSRAMITNPRQNQAFSDRISVSGILQKDNFAYYQIQYSNDQKTWNNVGGRYNTFPVQDFLGNWELATVPDGNYWVRVLVVDKSGNYGDPCSVPVVVRRNTPTPLPVGACGVPGATISSISFVKPDKTMVNERNLQQPITVNSSIGISGAAERTNFAYYVLQYSKDRQTWIEFARSYTPHPDDISSMGAWQTSTVPNGDYWIHVRVLDKSGNYSDSCDVHLIVNN
jgi:hypothetical protein